MAVNQIYIKVYNIDTVDNRLYNAAYQGVPVAGARFVYGTLQNVPSVQSKIILPADKYPGVELYSSLTVQALVTASNV